MKKERGFSLVEIMVASVILMTSATGMTTLYKQMADMQLQRSYLDIAVKLASEKVQDLNDYQTLQGKNALAGKSSYAQIRDNGGGVLPPGKVYIQPYKDSVSIVFERNWQVLNKKNFDRKSVVVTVSWQINKEKHNFKLTTVLVPIANHRRIHLTEHYPSP